MAKPPNLRVKSPVPRTSVIAATIRLRLSAKSTLLSTQMLGARDRDQAEHHDADAAHHRQRNGVDQRAELGREAQQDREQRGHDEDRRRVDLGRGHHADVLGIGRDAGAADRARWPSWRSPSPMKARPI